MFFIAGRKTDHLKTIHHKTAICPHCQAQGKLLFSVWSKYIRLYWVPTFPYTKFGQIECRQCGSKFNSKDLPESYRETLRQIKKDVRIPIWQFTGTFIFVLLIAWITFEIDNKEAVKQESIIQPKVGDVYNYKEEEDHYSTFKIEKVTKDSVFITYNTQEVSRVSHIYIINRAENYSSEIKGLSQKQLQDLMYSNTIVGIFRADQSNQLH